MRIARRVINVLWIMIGVLSFSALVLLHPPMASGIPYWGAFVAWCIAWLILPSMALPMPKENPKAGQLFERCRFYKAISRLCLSPFLLVGGILTLSMTISSNVGGIFVLGFVALGIMGITMLILFHRTAKKIRLA